jgi:hypothetical protein
MARPPTWPRWWRPPTPANEGPFVLAYLRAALPPEMRDWQFPQISRPEAPDT